MGSRFSSSASSAAGDSSNPPTAKVIAIDGSLKEYSATVMASQVLLGTHHHSSFLCSADNLYYDAGIPAMGSGEWLQLGQLYFVLPASKLESPLRGPDMVALAVKASSAMATAATRRRGRRRGFRVTPVAEGNGDGELDGLFMRFNEMSVGVLGPTSGHKKLGSSSSSSSRVRFARRLSRERLSTIGEVAE